MILVFIAICILLAIYIGYEFTHAPEMPEDEAESRAQQEREDFTEFTFRIPLGTFQEGEEISPWSMLERMHLEEKEETEE